MREFGRSRMPLLVGLLVLAAGGGGCRSTCGPDDYLCTTPMPRELDKVTMPEYVIEPPDILDVNVGRLVPLPPYRVEPLDVILIQVKPADPEAPISATNEAVLMMEPPPVRRSAGMPYLQPRKTPRRLIASVCSQTSSDVLTASSSPDSITPALLNKTSSLPNDCSATATICSQSVACDTSA